MACTPLRMLAPVPGSGLSTTVQDAPSQCSMRVWFTPPLAPQPTAQASHGNSTVVAARRLPDVRGLTAGVPDQLTQVAAEAVAVSRPASDPASVTGTRRTRRQRLARKCENAGKIPRMWRTLARAGGDHQQRKTPVIGVLTAELAMRRSWRGHRVRQPQPGGCRAPARLGTGGLPGQGK